MSHRSYAEIPLAKRGKEVIRRLEKSSIGTLTDGYDLFSSCSCLNLQVQSVDSLYNSGWGICVKVVTLEEARHTVYAATIILRLVTLVPVTLDGIDGVPVELGQIVDLLRN